MRSASILLAALAVGCGGTETYEVVQTAQATVAAGTAVDRISGDFGFADFEAIDLIQAATLSEANVTREQIETVFVSKIELSVVAPPMGQDLTFLDRVELFIEASGQEKKTIATGGPFDAATNPVELAPEALNVSPYTDTAAVKISSEYEGRAPTNETTLEARLTFTVQVQN